MVSLEKNSRMMALKVGAFRCSASWKVGTKSRNISSSGSGSIMMVSGFRKVCPSEEDLILLRLHWAKKQPKQEPYSQTLVIDLVNYKTWRSFPEGSLNSLAKDTLSAWQSGRRRRSRDITGHSSRWSKSIGKSLESESLLEIWRKYGNPKKILVRQGEQVEQQSK